MSSAYFHEDRRVLAVTGEDRLPWLNGLVTCNLTRVGARAGYGFLVEKKGKVVTDLFVVAGEGAFYLAVPHSAAAATLELLDHHLFSEDVTLAFADALRVVSVHGGLAVPAGAAAAGAWDPLGDGGSLLVAPAEALAALPVAAGDALVDFQLRAFLPRLGVDYDHDLLPHELSMDAVGVAFDKGCYLGQEVLYMLEHRGKARRRTVVLTSADPRALTLPPGAEITDGDAVVGALRVPHALSADSAEIATRALSADSAEIATRALSADSAAFVTNAFAQVKAAVAEEGRALTVAGVPFTVAKTGPRWG